MDVVLGRALAKQPADRYPSMIGICVRTARGATDTATTVKLSGAPYAGGLLGTYELGERLGPGRLGSEVFAGTHRALGHPVAIRLLRRTPTATGTPSAAGSCVKRRRCKSPTRL